MSKNCAGMEPQSQEMVAMLVGCLALFLVVRRLIVTMIVAVRVGRSRHLLDRSFRLYFHAKGENLRAMIYSSDTTCFNQVRMY